MSTAANSRSTTGSHHAIPEASQKRLEPLRARGTALLVVCLVAVLAYYVWLVSIGSWTQWPSLTHVYDQLASSFLHGQLALELEPDPALLAVAEPYDPGARKGIPFPLDVSLYNGKFYLYFGPVPGLVLALAKLVVPGTLGDVYLVFAFTAGLFVVQSLFALSIWKRFFQDAPLWSLAFALLVLGLAAPAGWLLSTASIYGASIMGGAFFFSAGLYSAFRALDATPISRLHLALAGAFWAAAVGSRMTQVLPVVLLTLLVCGAIIVRRPASPNTGAPARPILALLVSLGLGAAALGWYNWARFGSILETGITYQLSGGFQQHLNQLFSPLYMIQNLASYLVAPARLGYAFPYFKPAQGLLESVIAGLPLPDIYRASTMTGLLITSPFLLFSIVNIIHASRLFRSRTGSDHDRDSLSWLTAGLWVAFLSSFALFLSFFWSAERYMADFVPTWFLLSVIGFWHLGRSLSSHLTGRLLHFGVSLGLLVITALVSNLYALSFNAPGFRALNPVLWRQLGNLFRP